MAELYLMVGSVNDAVRDDNYDKHELRYGRDYGYGNIVMQSMGATGQYLTSPNWQRLGMARDRVFEISWSAATDTALNGCWINVIEAAT